MCGITPLPLLTADLPGTGGRPIAAEDFRVEEIPAYLPTGEGPHCFAFVEKRDLTTPAAIERICRELSLDRSAVGCAGLKDKRAVTRQWLSFAAVEPTALRSVQHDDLRVLEARCHRNKLRTGHLRGNRFSIVLRGVQPNAEDLALQVLSRLGREGLPNFYGPQRFGVAGDNAARALRMLRGAERLPRDRQQRRLLVSALQSYVFNEALRERIESRLLQKVLAGDVLQRTDSYALFVSEDRVADQLRLEAKEVSLTGPICGPRMPRPKTGGPAATVEDALFTALQIHPDEFARFGRLARGGRRALTVAVGEPAVTALALDGEAALRLDFALPAGAYATVLLREVTKAE